VELARKLNFSTTAMGIETPAQLALMQSLGCDRGQGYLFAKPLPPSDLGALLDTDDEMTSSSRAA
jgi:EAL domain-containing protein (putative c-di-GMP-specific phosphodiesterase class I)